MKADFFIDRPVFSTVLSIIIVIVGFIGLALLPVDQYPQIVPPVVRISASYPGADAQTESPCVSIFMPISERSSKTRRSGWEERRKPFNVILCVSLAAASQKAAFDQSPWASVIPDGAV